MVFVFLFFRLQKSVNKGRNDAKNLNSIISQHEFSCRNIFFVDIFCFDLFASVFQNNRRSKRSRLRGKMIEIYLQNMSKADKSYYLNKAKGAKFAANKKGKLTGTGESIDELEMEERRKKEFLLKMNDDIAQTINDADRDKSLFTFFTFF